MDTRLQKSATGRPTKLCHFRVLTGLRFLAKNRPGPETQLLHFSRLVPRSRFWSYFLFNGRDNSDIWLIESVLVKFM